MFSWNIDIRIYIFWPTNMDTGLVLQRNMNIEGFNWNNVLGIIVNVEV